MNLNEYFASKPYGSKAALAKRVGISKTWMSQIISGRQPCSPELAVKIFDATSGEVRKEDLRPDIFGDTRAVVQV